MQSAVNSKNFGKRFQTIPPLKPPPLSLREAIDALRNNCAKIRVIDVRSGRCVELHANAPVVPYILRMLRGDSGTLSSALPRPVLSAGIKPREVLNSWKEIAVYMKCGKRTCQRYQKMLGLPVRHIADGMRGPVLAFEDELDAWLERRPSMQVSAKSSKTGKAASNAA